MTREEQLIHEIARRKGVIAEVMTYEKLRCHQETTHEREAAQADVRFVTVKELQDESQS